MVDEPNVLVAENVVEAEKNCAAVHVAEDASVRNPGFTKLSVTEPVAFEAEIYVPEEMEVTPDAGVEVTYLFPFKSKRFCT